MIVVRLQFKVTFSLSGRFPVFIYQFTSGNGKCTIKIQESSFLKMNSEKVREYVGSFRTGTAFCLCRQRNSVKSSGKSVAANERTKPCNSSILSYSTNLLQWTLMPNVLYADKSKFLMSFIKINYVANSVRAHLPPSFSNVNSTSSPLEMPLMTKILWLLSVYVCP